MIAKLLAWLREVWSKMINRTDVKRTMGVEVAISQPMAQALEKWSAMYANRSPWLGTDVKSMNLAATISAEIARAVTIEMEVDLGVTPRGKYLGEQLQDLLAGIRQHVEVGCAKGGLMLKPYVKDDGIIVDVVQADQFFPVEFDATGRITSCVFADHIRQDRKFYTRLELHRMVDNGCEVVNQAFESTAENSLGFKVPLTKVPQWADLTEQATIKGIERPLFAYFKFPMANNVDPTSPLGVSCFSRAVELIEQADRQWSELLWEFESGRRALYADTQAFDKDKDGKPVLPIRRLYRTLNATGNVGEKGKLFEEWTPTLRETNMLSGLDAMLKQVEFSCGLAQGTISDPNSVQLTATEIKMSKQRTYATVTDTQKALKRAMDDLLAAMDTWATLKKLAPKGKFEATYEFDDSIVADHDTQFTQDSQAVGMGVMPKYVFLVRNYGLSEEEAKKMVGEVRAEEPKVEEPVEE